LALVITGRLGIQKSDQGRYGLICHCDQGP
jgi:hypothetical protein